MNFPEYRSGSGQRTQYPHDPASGAAHRQYRNGFVTVQNFNAFPSLPRVRRNDAARLSNTLMILFVAPLSR